MIHPVFNNAFLCALCIFAVILPGCHSEQNIGMEMLPYPAKVETPEPFVPTPEQAAHILALARTDPDTYKLVHDRLEAYKSACAQYQAVNETNVKNAIGINTEEMLSRPNHLSKDAIKLAIAHDLQRQGWTADDCKRFGL